MVENKQAPNPTFKVDAVVNAIQNVFDQVKHDKENAQNINEFRSEIRNLMLKKAKKRWTTQNKFAYFYILQLQKLFIVLLFIVQQSPPTLPNFSFFDKIFREGV